VCEIIRGGGRAAVTVTNIDEYETIHTTVCVVCLRVSDDV